MVIKYGKRGGAKKAVIIKVEEKKRKKTDGYRIVTVDIVKHKIIFYYVNSLTDNIKNVKVLGKATEDNFYKANGIWSRYNIDKRNNKKEKESHFKNRFNLNASYRYKKVFIKLKNGKWYRVIKTSCKSVYYFDPETNKRRYVSFASIVDFHNTEFYDFNF